MLHQAPLLSMKCPDNHFKLGQPGGSREEQNPTTKDIQTQDHRDGRQTRHNNFLWKQLICYTDKMASSSQTIWPVHSRETNIARYMKINYSFLK